MEGKPEAQPKPGEQMHCEREPEEDDCKPWPGGQVGNTLHLVSAVAQWILLLACLIYLGIDFLQPPAVRAHVQPSVCWPVKLSMGLIFFFFFLRKAKKLLSLSLSLFKFLIPSV